MKYKRFLSLAAALLLTVLLAVPALALSAGTATVKADWLNFRDAPSMQGHVLGLAPNGSKVEILEDQGEWCRVRWNGQEGYMCSRYLVQESVAQPAPSAAPVQPAPAVQPAPSASPAQPEPAAQPVTAPQPEPDPAATATAQPEPAEETYPQVGILTGDAVRFREKPDLSSEIYGHFYCGNRVSVLGQEGDWYRVEYGGRIGYVYGQYVSIRKPAADGGEESAAPADGSLAESIISCAKKNLGVPYVYGGASPNGFDCSGLVYYCYLQSGMRIERTATAQYRQGVYVEKDKLEPGDLVFFATPGTNSIGHVGIYIGDGEFIHASTGHGYIMVAELSNSYFTTYYYGACRISE